MLAPLFGMVSMATMVVVGIVGVLIFGRRLPEVGRYLGQSIVQFKAGIRGLEDEVGNTVHRTNELPAEVPKPPQRITNPTPKFDTTGANVSTPTQTPGA
jgi:sec-independent protein translocase protein TatA